MGRPGCRWSEERHVAMERRSGRVDPGCRCHFATIGPARSRHDIRPFSPSPGSFRGLHWVQPSWAAGSVGTLKWTSQPCFSGNGMWSAGGLSCRENWRHAQLGIEWEEGERLWRGGILNREGGESCRIAPGVSAASVRASRSPAPRSPTTGKTAISPRGAQHAPKKASRCPPSDGPVLDAESEYRAVEQGAVVRHQRGASLDGGAAQPPASRPSRRIRMISPVDSPCHGPSAAIRVPSPGPSRRRDGTARNSTSRSST